jgi:hypothetical protein
MKMFELSATGRRMPGLFVDGKAVEFAERWEKEKKALKEVDWKQTPLFTAYQELTSGSLADQLEAVKKGFIFSVVEIEYTISLI